MKYWFLALVFLALLATPAVAEEWTAPEVTGETADRMPQQAGSFWDDLVYVIREALGEVMPQLRQGCGLCLCIVAVLLLVSVVQSFSEQAKATVELTAVVALSCLVMQSTGSMIELGSETVQQVSSYMTLLLPVLASVHAAQGGAASSSALYTLTAGFNAAAGAVVSSVLLPMVSVFLVLAIITAAIADDTVKKLRDMVKSIVSWLLKTVLYVYIGFLSVTGIITGTVDQAAVKAAKLTISGAVPVVGGILSDASETILVSTGMVKNSVGVYGLTAVLAICIVPFLRMGMQYLLWKGTAMVCAMFSGKKAVALVEDFSTAMGLLLAMTGTVCLLLMISIVCFLKGIG